MKLTLLGTGTPTPSLVRASSSYLLEVGDDLILFDAGPGAYIRYLQTGKSLTDLTHIVISHFHYDHCVDFAAIALARWDQAAGLSPDLQVIGPKHVTDFVHSLFDEQGAFGPDQAARTQHGASIGYYRARGGVGDRAVISPHVTEFMANDLFEGNGWTLSCVEVPHVQPYLSSLAFRLDFGERSFCYSGDASYSKAFINLAHETDVMVHMCHRISGTERHPDSRKSSAGHLEAAKIAAEANAKTCVFSHISDQMDVPGIPERLLREINDVYAGNAIWARDLMEIDFAEPAPRELI